MRGLWTTAPDAIAASTGTDRVGNDAVDEAVSGTDIGRAMSIEFLHTHPADDCPILLPEIGLELRVRLQPRHSGGQLTIIETVNAPGFGPPLHRHAETEVFHVINGRYLFEVDGRRFHAVTGDVVCVLGGAAHGFVNVTDAPAGQFVMILPGLDAVTFFKGLHAVMAGGAPDHAAMEEFGQRWGVKFLGPPLRPDLEAGGDGDEHRR